MSFCTFRQRVSCLRLQSMGKLDTEQMAVNAAKRICLRSHRWCSKPPQMNSLPLDKRSKSTLRGITAEEAHPETMPPVSL